MFNGSFWKKKEKWKLFLQTMKTLTNDLLCTTYHSFEMEMMLVAEVFDASTQHHTAGLDMSSEPCWNFKALGDAWEWKHMLQSTTCRQQYFCVKMSEAIINVTCHESSEQHNGDESCHHIEYNTAPNIFKTNNNYDHCWLSRYRQIMVKNQITEQKIVSINLHIIILTLIAISRHIMQSTIWSSYTLFKYG